MTLPVIVTRSQPGASETAGSLTQLGVWPILSPMLQIAETGFDPAVLDDVRHIIFTSANGVHALRGDAVPRGICAWCVGPSTGEAAREAGFTQVIEGGGNADDLARKIIAAAPKGPLLHVANEAAAGNLVAHLKNAGFDARFAAPYRTDPAASLNGEALTALDAARAIIVLVHSAKAAAALAASGPNLERAAIVAISEAALAPLTGQAGLGDWVARKPNDADLMQAVLLAKTALLR